MDYLDLATVRKGAQTARGTNQAICKTDQAASKTEQTVGKTDQAVWLDELPTDVCDRIATFVLCPHYSADVINLSKVSEKQRQAVKNELSVMFNLWEFSCSMVKSCCNKNLLSEVATLLGTDANEIHAPGHLLHTDYIDKCFKSLSLVKATIYDCPGRFYPLSYARNLRSLSLKFSHCENMKSLVKRLSILDLRHLSLTTVEPCCLHEQFSDDPEQYSTLATWFPKVENLKLACYCCGGRDNPHSFLWHAIEQFPALKEVFIPEGVPIEAIDKLREMDRVSLRAGAVFQLMDKIPDQIVHVDSYDLYHRCANGTRTLYSSHLDQLANCRRLEELQCIIKPGAEYGLVPVMSNLRFLSIEFDPEDGTDSDEARVVYEPEEGVLLEAIKAAPFLKNLTFECVRIKRRELREMLRFLGERLEHYEERLRSKCGEEITYDLESPKREIQELVETLQTAALCNPSLRTFHLDGYIGEVDKCDIEPELATYDATLGVFQRRAPLAFIRQFRLLRERIEKISTPHDHD